MADTKISALPVGTVTPASILPAVNGAVTQRVTVQQLRDAIGGATIFSAATSPTANKQGDLWIQPQPDGKEKLLVWTGTLWDEVQLGSADLHIVSTSEPPAGTEVGQLWIDPDGTVTVTPGAVDVLAAIKGQIIAPKAIDLDGPNTLFITANPDGTAKLTLRVDGTPLRAVTEESVATEEWVLAQLGSITPTSTFNNATPPVYADAPVTEQPNGLPIGLTPDGMEIHQPYMVGAVPVMVGGKRFLMPLLEAPAPTPGSDPTPLFTYSDSPVTQQLDGTTIGLSADGMEITQPLMVGGIYVLAGGKKYLIPVIEE